MERLKKVIVKGSRRSNNDEDCEVGGKCNGGSSSGGGSEGEEGYIFRATLNTNGHSSQKRVKLQGKASPSDNFRPVDPAIVPRRLRSAINKRLCQLESPPLSDLKRKQLHSVNGTQLSNGYIAERFRQNMFDQVTKDEEEVAQALTMLIKPVTISKLIKKREDRRTLEENSETKEVVASFSEALKETTKVLLQCNGSIGNNTSPCGEESHRDVLKPETLVLEKRIAVSVSPNFDAGKNQTTQPDSCTTPLSNNRKEGDVASVRNARTSPLGTSLQTLAGNGGLQQTRLAASSMRRCDIELWPLGFAPTEQNMQSVKKKFDNGTAHYISQREATPGMFHGLSSNVHGHLTISSSSKATVCPRSVTASARCSSNGNDPPTEMLSSLDGKAPCKKCATHVYISHLIRNYQNTEKRQQPLLPVNQSKAGEATISALQKADGTAGLRNSNSPPISNGFHMEKSYLEGNPQMLHDGRLLEAQQISTLSGAYAQQKQGGELSVSASVDAKNSGNGSKSTEQFHVPYLPHHSLVPFPFPRGPYSSRYQDQLAAAASHQLPHFVGTSALYGTQMVQTAGGTTVKQQQQPPPPPMLWQAQMAYLRPPSGFPVKWQQNGHHSNSSSSLSLCTQSPPKDYRPANTQQHFLLSVPSSSSSMPSISKQQHQQNGFALNLDASSQLQVLCDADTYR